MFNEAYLHLKLEIGGAIWTELNEKASPLRYNWLLPFLRQRYCDPTSHAPNAWQFRYFLRVFSTWQGCVVIVFFESGGTSWIHLRFSCPCVRFVVRLISGGWYPWQKWGSTGVGTKTSTRRGSSVTILSMCRLKAVSWATIRWPASDAASLLPSWPSHVHCASWRLLGEFLPKDCWEHLYQVFLSMCLAEPQILQWFRIQN